MKLSCAVITLNEERNIEDCLKNLNFADEIVVMDSGSSDHTVALARKYTPHVYSRSFADFSTQKNAAIEKAQGEWIFFVDADERVPEALAKEIRDLLALSQPDAVYAVKRETFFFGKRLRFSGTQNDTPLRLFPRLKAKFTQPVHELLESTLPTKRLRNSMIHLTTQNRDQYREKMKRYLPLEVDYLTRRNQPRNISDIFIKPPAVFVFLYFFKLGILDGWTGFQFASLSAFYSFIKYKNYCFKPSV